MTIPDNANQNASTLTDERAQRFMKLYMSIQRRLYGYILSLLPNSSEVDDLVQDTVITMWGQFDRFEFGTDFAAWAFCIARNRVMNHIQRQKTRSRYFNEKTMLAIEEMVSEKSKHEDERLNTLRQCIGKLTVADRNLLKLRYDVGETLKSVSERVGQSVNTLYTRLYKIRISLLHCVEKKMIRETL